MLDSSIDGIEVQRAMAGLHERAGAAGAHGERAERDDRETYGREYAHEKTPLAAGAVPRRCFLVDVFVVMIRS